MISRTFDLRFSTLVFILLFLSMGSGMSLGQMARLEIKPDFPSYVVGEPVMASVVIVNHGAEPIVLDNDLPAFKNNRFGIEIYQHANERLPPMTANPILNDVHLENGERLSTKIDVGAWYSLLDMGRYYMRIVVINNNLRYTSDEVAIEIVPGISLSNFKQVVRAERETVERSFNLVYWARADREDALLRISDSPGNVVWTTLHLGPIVRIKPPTLKQLSFDEIEVRHQASRDVWKTTLIKSDSNGPSILNQSNTIDAVSSPMVNSLEDIVERNPPKKKSGRRRRR